MPQRKPFYQRAGNRTDVQKYPAALDTADSIYAANYLLGYFRTAMDAPHLMRLQKVEDLKQKGLWDEEYETPFLSIADIAESDFGVNVNAVSGTVETRRKNPQYLDLLDHTSTHINAGEWRCIDFVVILTHDHINN